MRVGALIVAAVIGEGCSEVGGRLDFTPRKFPLVSLGKQLLGVGSSLWFSPLALSSERPPRNEKGEQAEGLHGPGPLWCSWGLAPRSQEELGGTFF